MDPIRWRAQGNRIEIAGHQIFVADSAPGAHERETLLLIHGFPTASWDFARIWPTLSQHWRLLAPDLLGFGYSDKPAAHHYTIAGQADICEAVLTQAGARRCHVLAHDYGDTVAQELLARELARRRHDPARTRLQSVCFLNGGLFPETHHARLIQKVLASPLGPLANRLASKRTFARNMCAVFGPDTPPTTADLDGFWALINHNGGRIVFHKLIGYMAERRQHRERWVGALSAALATGIPLAVINGSVDPVSGAHMVARWREVVAGGHIVELPGIGHYPQVEAPEAVLKEYLGWRAGIAGTR